MTMLSRLTVIAALAVLGTIGVASAQAAERSAGYWYDNAGNVWKNNYKECWRAGYWTPSMATAECDPDLVKKEEQKPAAAKQDTVPAQPLVPPTGPAKPAFAKVTIQAEALFDFDKAVVRPDGKEVLDREVVAKMKQYPQVEVLLITGHADRIGSEKYNMKLSERRAKAVKDYLISQGIEANRLETAAKGESEPVVSCKEIKGPENRHNKKLVECLQPNRRVVVEIKVQKSSAD
ncbi:MAG: OmpA family protein [Burkholderiales bacterium]|jgi:OOP family OmpA-OmpF porin|nr:OmpA family protein [Burkholderiales bacterium]